MKIIEKETPLLMLRVNDFEEYNFINEHLKCLETKSSVWMLKAGRHLSDKSVKIIKDTGVVILKEQKKSGNRFFIATVKDIKQGAKMPEMSIPDYYQKLSEYGLTLEGTWIELMEMHQAIEEMLDTLILVKDHQKVVEVVGKTRAPILYCTCAENITI